MFGMSVKVEMDTKPLTKAVDDSAFRNLGHAAASIRKTAIESIQQSAYPSAVGDPPHTRRGALPRSILFAVDSEGAVIGPSFLAIVDVAAAHEFGEEFRGTQFPARPFMGPALEQNLDRFASQWAGSIG